MYWVSYLAKSVVQCVLGEQSKNVCVQIQPLTDLKVSTNKLVALQTPTLSSHYSACVYFTNLTKYACTIACHLNVQSDALL